MGLWLLGAAKILLVAQATSAAVAGEVRDGGNGEPLAGAVVSLPDLERRVVTDAAGRYLFDGVPAGPQHIVVRRIGYAPRTLHALVPSRGTIEIDIALRAEPITLGAIEARPAVPVRGLDDGDSTAFPDRGLSILAIRHHPLLAEPDAFQALSGGEVVLRPETPSGMHVRGGASDQVAYLLDGIPVLNPYHAAGTFSAWNPDALSLLRLETPSAAAGFPDALSGVVSATTRAPGAQLQTHGSLGTTQARVTIDGPLGHAGAGYLLSVRSGFPGSPAPRRESSYLRAETGDWLVKLESPLLGGRARVLGYGSDSEIGATARATSDVAGAPPPPVDPARHAFDWHSTSVGAEWTRQLGRLALRVRGWSARGDAAAVWHRTDSAPGQLAAERRDEGLLASLELSEDPPRKSVAAGLRTERSWTSYRFGTLELAQPSFELVARTPVSAAFVRLAHPIAAGADVDLALLGAVGAGDVHISPHAQLRWRPSSALSLSASYARLHQYAQSLRNAESVVGAIFPVDLFVGAGSSAIPVARSDLGILGLDYQPIAGIRIGGRAYARSFEGLLLVAPRAAEPFATSSAAVGSGEARGLSVDVAAHGARYGMIAAYGLQHVRFQYGDTSYIPEHGTVHSIETGVIVYPSATFSVRLGASGALGRRTTAARGAIEWEACNLLDQGCEFAGAPQQGIGALGGTRLPAYVRLDLGVRKHWHVKLANRDGVVALFGTLTNLFGRRNVLTLATDPTTGEAAVIEMRPRGPLLAGVDWRF